MRPFHFLCAAALVPLAASLTGYWRRRLGLASRLALGALFLLSIWPTIGWAWNLVGLAAGFGLLRLRGRRPSAAS